MVRSSEDLVPKGLPYGSRGDTVAQMKAADVPLNSASGGGAPPGPTATVPPAVAPAPAAPVSRAGLAGYDVLANREPTPQFQATPPRQVMFEKVRQSNNAVMQEIFARMPGYKEG
jgi:hypothetical protein